MPKILKEIEQYVQNHALIFMASQMQAGIFFSDSRRRCVYVNSEWEKITGLPAEKAYGYGWLSIIHPDDLDFVKQKTIIAHEEDRLLDIAFRSLTPQKEVKYVQLRSIKVQFSEQTAGFMGFVIDTTHTQEAESNALRDKRNFSSLVNSIDDVIVEINADFIVVNLWSGLFKNTPQLPKSVIGQPLDKVHFSRYLAAGKETIQRVLETKKTELFEFQSSDPNDRKWFSTKISFVQESNLEGNPRVLCVMRDITEQKAALLALRESEEKFTSAFEYAAIGMAIVSLEGRFLQVNKSLCKITGYSEAELLEIDFQTLTHKDDLNTDLEYVNQVLAGEKEAYEMEKRYIHKNGSIVWILLSVSVVRNEKNTAQYFISQVQDISMRKENEAALRITMEEAEEATKAKSDFLSIMSHEIRTPLNAIIGLTQILNHDNPSPHQVENLKVLDFSAQNLLILVNDILDYNKIEAGKVEFEKTNFNLKSLLSNVKEANRISAEEKGISLKLMLDEDIPDMFVGDPTRISQIINNLVSNAVKFTEQGQVTISGVVVKKDDEKASIRFSVRDTGIGIPREKQAIIFDMFTQANSSTTREFGGTGLGLSITKKLINLLGGEIYVESDPGNGSHFYFTLEMRVSNLKPHVPEPVTSIDGISLKGMQVLVVEDNNINVFLLTKLLSNWGIAYEIAENGEQAVNLARENTYHAILMDLQMPVLNGYDATTIIRSYNTEVPIIALSADSLPDICEKVKGYGMNDCVSKPFNNRELKGVLAKYYTNGAAVSG